MEIPTKQVANFERVLIEEGLYTGVLKNIKSAGMKTFSGKKAGESERSAEQIVLEFEVVYKKQNVLLAFFGYAPATSQNKLGQALAALGADLSKPVNTDALVGKQAKLFVENFEKVLLNGDKVKCSGVSKVKPVVVVENV